VYFVLLIISVHSLGISCYIDISLYTANYKTAVIHIYSNVAT